ncbi:(d)CMP kinase [uncultured Tyzzerella sp.]|uniref:(d)CMP kinase n=1 Tax=uncultured Tyzzerella sp. TaxID=2321398 RepID=UPI002942C1FD|nr:(d)CMP kinase [uncultured Tyzzerella sp.]
MNICSIRGAITIEENTKENIIKNAEILLNEIIEKNGINKEDIINIIFSATKDITKAYPAIATRNMGITDCAIMCMQEMDIEFSLPMCIRVMITVNLDIKKQDIKHIYLKGAKKLRPDIALKNTGFAVAIDGPAGSGKSTVSKIICKELNFIYVDTGAMFRTITLYCLQNDIDCNNKDEVTKELKNINISLDFENGIQQIYLNNENVTDKIRTQEIAKNASIIAQIPSVREKLLNMQRKIAKDSNVIMDGRDIGTNVLPNANVKIYLDADIDERAKRRCEELSLKNEKFEYDKVRQGIIDRDNADKNREIVPLKKADNAITINTTNLSIYEVSDYIIKIIKENIK